MLKYADEGFSEEFLERPALNRLREDAGKGLISQVICYDQTVFLRELISDEKNDFHIFQIEKAGI